MAVKKKTKDVSGKSVRRTAGQGQVSKTTTTGNGPSLKSMKPPSGKPGGDLPSIDTPLKITERLFRNWMRIRQAWSIDTDHLSGAVSGLSDDESRELYLVVRLSLYKDNIAQILRKHPELKRLLRSDEDRLCMHDLYEYLSWKLRLQEPPPRYREMQDRLRERMGRTPDFLK